MVGKEFNEHPQVNGHLPEDDDAAEVSETPPDHGGLSFDEAVEEQEGPAFD